MDRRAAALQVRYIVLVNVKGIRIVSGAATYPSTAIGCGIVRFGVRGHEARGVGWVVWVAAIEGTALVLTI